MIRGSCLLLVILAAAAAARADDLVPPDWRGQPNSTLQVWEFSTGSNPVEPTVAPDLLNNPYGTPEATVYGEFNFPNRDTWWINTSVTIPDHQGIWNIGGSLSLDIPNDPVLRPHKFIRVQITYDGGHSVDPGVPFDPWVDVVASDGATMVDFQKVSEIHVDSIFTHAVYDLMLEPNPSFETIWILPRYCQLYVDEVVVDTLCIPEPATMLLLAAGAAALIRRR